MDETLAERLESIRFQANLLCDFIEAQGRAIWIRHETETDKPGWFIRPRNRGADTLTWRSTTTRLDISKNNEGGNFSFAINAREMKGATMLRCFAIVFHEDGPRVKNWNTLDCHNSETMPDDNLRWLEKTIEELMKE